MSNNETQITDEKKSLSKSEKQKNKVLQIKKKLEQAEKTLKELQEKELLEQKEQIIKLLEQHGLFSVDFNTWKSKIVEITNKIKSD